jgi:iron complex outermembrane receptor protein
MLLVLSFIFFAQSAPAEENKLVPQEQTGNTIEPKFTEKLPEVVVTGERPKGHKTPSTKSLTLTDTPPLELPLSYEVIDNDILEELGVSKYADALEYTSGVRMTEPAFLGTAAGGSSVVRGFGNTETTINGFAIPKEVNLFLDSAGIERIEFFKGSAASIQGSAAANPGATAGVGGGTNIVTKSPEKESFSYNSAEAKVGNGRMYRGQIDYNAPIAKNVLFRMNTAAKTERPFYLPSGCDSNTGLFLSPSVTVYPADKLEITLEGSHQHEEDASYYGIPPELTGKPRICDYDTYYGSNDTRTRYEGSIAQLRSKWTINNYLTANAGVSQLHADVYANIIGMSFGAVGNPLTFFDKVYATGTSPFSKSDTDATYDRSGYNVNLTVHHNLKKIDNTLVAGFDYFKSESDLISKTATTTTWYSVNAPFPSTVTFPAAAAMKTESTAKRDGIFLLDQLSWNSWRFIAGVRTDNHKSMNDITGVEYDASNVFSSRFGITYLFKPNLAAYGAYINTKGPNLGLFDANRNEITDDWAANMVELGIKMEPMKNLLCTVAGFSIKDENIPVTDRATGITELTGEQKSRGIEATVSGNITDNWNTQVSYTFLERDKKTLWPIIAKHDAAVRQTYSIPHTNLKVGMNNKYVSERDVNYPAAPSTDLPGAYTLPSYCVTDLLIEYTFQGKANLFMLRVNANNVFDERYFTAVRHVTKASPGEPFNTMVTLTTKF